MMASTYVGMVVASNKNKKVIDQSLSITVALDDEAARQGILSQITDDVFPEKDGWENHSVIAVKIRPEQAKGITQPYLHIYGIRAVKDLGAGPTDMKIAVTYEITEGDNPLGHLRLEHQFCTYFPPEEGWDIYVGRITKPLIINYVPESAIGSDINKN